MDSATRRIEINGAPLNGRQSAALRALLKRKLIDPATDRGEARDLAVILARCVGADPTDAEQTLLSRYFGGAAG